MLYTQHTQQWGNATGIRLPKKVLQAAQWDDKQVVSINLHGSSITLTPIKTPQPTSKKHKIPRLEDLLKGVTPEKIAGQWDWGPDRGNEIIRD